MFNMCCLWFNMFSYGFLWFIEIITILNSIIIELKEMEQPKLGKCLFLGISAEML